jgi:hypothetical protein
MRLFYRLLIALLVLALFAGDSFAGPAAATYAHAVPAFHPGALVLGGCAGGRCPAR